MLFPEAELVDDEAFWREQERRRQGLGQPCCTQSNMSWSLVDTSGDFCVVIHGESDCLNCFFHHDGRRIVDYYSTRLTERQLIMGQTHEPLRRLLRLIAAERRPEAVLVLGTCPVEVIFDEFEPVVHSVSRETGIPMVALRTHGLSLMNQVACQDWLYSALAALEPSPPPEGEARVNVVGLPPYPEVAELSEVLAAVGEPLNGLYPAHSLADWRRIAHAGHSFVVDRQMYPRLSLALEGHGHHLAELPLPIGLFQTERFYGLLGDRLGCGEAMARAIAPLAEAHDEAFKAVKARVEGRRLALCIRMLKTHRADLLAYEGLGALELLRGLGFELEIRVQGPPEDAAREAFGRRLAELGHGGIPFDVFRGPWELGEQLKAGGFEVAVMSDVARNVVEEAGVQMIPAAAWRPFFRGMPHNLRMIDRTADAL